MGRSQETFGKKEREKKKQKKREEKAKRKEERKNQEGGGLDDMIAYVDEYGRITDTPPEARAREEIDAESIEIGVPKKEDIEEETDFLGKVEFFNDSKGYGFIKDINSGEKYFYHINNCLDEVGEGDKVSFELEKGQRGLNAVRVKKA